MGFGSIYRPLVVNIGRWVGEERGGWALSNMVLMNLTLTMSPVRQTDSGITKETLNEMNRGSAPQTIMEVAAHDDDDEDGGRGLAGLGGSLCFNISDGSVIKFQAIG